VNAAARREIAAGRLGLGPEVEADRQDRAGEEQEDQNRNPGGFVNHKVSGMSYFDLRQAFI
jgi:hypothetical protein